MTKLISYSLFNAPCETFERRAYIRGFYWNARMNNLIYPDWRTHLEVDIDLHDEYRKLFDWLIENNNLSLSIGPRMTPLCEAMLWRMKPIWKEDISHVLCRDADAITTYREAMKVQAWLESNYEAHAIHDNPAHGGLMGGMVGFRCAEFKARTGWNSFQEMITGKDLSERGSDQHLLNKEVLTRMNPYIKWSDTTMVERNLPLPQVDLKYTESNLVCRHIGSAGVVEMELLRFFMRHDAYNWKFQPIEKEYPKLFYWHV